MIEEHGGDEGLLSEVINDNKISKANLTKRIKEIKKLHGYEDELEVLNKYLKLMEEVSDKDKKIKELKEALDKKVMIKYKELSEEEIKEIVIQDKWMKVLLEAIEELLDGISQSLTGRIMELAKRYEEPMSQIEAEVEELTNKVDEHLKRMGFVW